MSKLLTKVLSTEGYEHIDFIDQYRLSDLIKDWDILSEEEKKYGSHHLTTVDFLLFNKLNKKSILVIEVDGYKFHNKDSKQYQRDLMKNNMLNLMGIEYLRTPTNGSLEKDKIIKKLNSII